jgi:hypothetical protein
MAMLLQVEVISPSGGFGGLHHHNSIGLNSLNALCHGEKTGSGKTGYF